MQNKNQSEKILQHLQRYGSITSLEAIEEYGATRLSAIIFNLKKQGYEIDSVRVKKQNRFGDSVHISKYSLHKGEDNECI